MGLYEVPLYTHLWYYVFVKSSFKHACEKCESKRDNLF